LKILPREIGVSISGYKLPVSIYPNEDSAVIETIMCSFGEIDRPTDNTHILGPC
jgi:hypothetical protein